jgi:hypothetical protein
VGLAVAAQLLIGGTSTFSAGSSRAVNPTDVLGRQMLFSTGQVGEPMAVAGLLRLLGCILDHLGVWSFVFYAGITFWGSAAVMGALRWRSSSSWAAADLDSIHLS